MNLRTVLSAGLLLLLTSLSNSAINLVGTSSQYIDFGDVAAFNLTTSLTMSLWLKSTDIETGAGGMIMNKWDGGGNGYILWATGGNVLLGDAQSTELIWSGGEALLEDGFWHHLCATINGTRGEIFFDGVSKAVDTTGFAVASPANVSLIVGKYTSGSYATMTVSDVRLYKRPLSNAEIESLAKSRDRLTITDGLVGWWPLNEGNDGAKAGGATAFDRSGNGNNGTPSASPLWNADSWISH